MKARGFSLVEMVLVIAAVSILTAIGTMNFNAYAKRYKTEAQTRLLYSELLRARVNAVHQGRPIRIKLYRARFEVYSSERDNADGVSPLQTHTLDYPITSTASEGNATQGYPLQFEPNGLAKVLGSICLEQSAGSGAVDSIKIAFTRVSIGKKDRGEECNADNITIK